jgi:hypothetical protein
MSDTSGNLDVNNDGCVQQVNFDTMTLIYIDSLGNTCSRHIEYFDGEFMYWSLIFNNWEHLIPSIANKLEKLYIAYLCDTSILGE